MTDVLDAVVFGLAAHRATRLVTKDTITAKARDAIIWHAYGEPVKADRPGLGVISDGDESEPWTPAGGWTLYAEQDEEAPMLATLLSCRWCASVWLTAWLLAVSWVFPRPARILRFLLAGSSAAVLIARIEKS